jgi:hypothetical protein
MCDVKRQLSKFHTTVRLPANVAPEQKFVEKATSYVATDGGTPVIGELCKKLLLLSPYRPRSVLGIRSWWSKFDASVQYPNRNVDGWMDVEFENQFPEFDRDQFNQWLVGSQSSEELLSAPLCAEPRPPTPAESDVVVGEEVVPSRPRDETAERCDEVKTTRKAGPGSKKFVTRRGRTRTRPRQKSTRKSNDARLGPSS